MKFKDRRLPKATPEVARRVWEAKQHPSTRTVARALTVSGRAVHWTTIARWKARNWVPVKSDHPLEIARRQPEGVASIVSGDPETTLKELVDDPTRREFGELSDGEVLRRAAREVAIATTIIAKAIRNRTSETFNVAESTSALLPIAACLTALLSAFDQVMKLEATDQGSGGFRSRT